MTSNSHGTDSVDYVLCVLAEQLYRSDLTPSSRLLDEGILDSLGFVDLILRIEQDLDVRIGIEETDLEIFATPRTIAEHVDRLRAAAEAPATDDGTQTADDPGDIRP